MIQIDGSYGEGGGQILRTTIALSTLTQTPVKIINIRAKRPQPGLRPQHYTALTCLQTLCNAETQGLTIGSTTVTFHPKTLHPDNYTFNIGTAGSIPLVFQTIILACLQTKKPLTINLSGGTDVKWAPSWDYFTHIFLPLIQNIGVKVEAQLHQRGYYPKGGGKATLTIHPTTNLKPFLLSTTKFDNTIQGIIHSGNLPNHIATRIKHTVIKEALSKGFKTQITTQNTHSLSPGVGITLWITKQPSIIGTTILGEKGISAEEVGKNAFTLLYQQIQTNTTLDPYAVDQILPYMVLTIHKGTSQCITSEISNHTNTHMWLLKQFYPISFSTKQEKNRVQLEIIKKN